MLPSKVVFSSLFIISVSLSSASSNFPQPPENPGTKPHIQHSSTCLSNTFFARCIIRLRNSLPHCVTETKDVNVWKGRLDKFLPRWATGECHRTCGTDPNATCGSGSPGIVEGQKTGKIPWEGMAQPWPCIFEHLLLTWLETAQGLDGAWV